MAEVISYQIIGLDELIRKASSPEVLGEPLHQFFNQSLNTLIREVIPHTPRDTGQLAGDIPLHNQVDPALVPLWGSMGTTLNNPPYPIFVEEGTRPHWPPQSANNPRAAGLRSWARRHGIPVFLVARAIARHGTQGKYMFQRGLLTFTLGGGLNNLLQTCARNIEARWAR